MLIITTLLVAFWKSRRYLFNLFTILNITSLNSSWYANVFPSPCLFGVVMAFQYMLFITAIVYSYIFTLFAYLSTILNVLITFFYALGTILFSIQTIEENVLLLTHILVKLSLIFVLKTIMHWHGCDSHSFVNVAMFLTHSSFMLHCIMHTVTISAAPFHSYDMLTLLIYVHY